MKARVLFPAAGLLIIGGILFLIFFPGDEEEPATSSPQKTARRPVETGRKPEHIPVRVPKEKSADGPPPADEAPEPLTPEQEELATQSKASAVYRLILTYAQDHDGAFPPDLSALVASGLMPPEKAGEYLSGVIEYRGSELTNRDEGRKLVMRYRIGKRTDHEVRVYVSGSVNVRPANETDLPTGPPRK